MTEEEYMDDDQLDGKENDKERKLKQTQIGILTSTPCFARRRIARAVAGPWQRDAVAGRWR